MKNTRRIMFPIVAALAALSASCMDSDPSGVPSSVAAARVGPPATCCFHDGDIFRTLVPPSAFPNAGRDPLYNFGPGGQMSVVAVVPGEPGYHGGQWAFHAVTWNVAPYLITSADQLLAAEQDGDVTITRVPENDFRCPIQR